jgi:acyl-coenzyme A thioesterase PaaI-like protein
MSTSREAELLAADRFATGLGVELVSAAASAVEVAATLGAVHVDAAGRLRPGVAFTIADCAMSLISNARARAFAVSAHLVVTGTVAEGDRLLAVATPVHSEPGRVTWHVTVTCGDTPIATFTGTTLEVSA